MNPIPYLTGQGKATQLMVDGKPFRILGGELHNSSGSSLEYMDSVVWPGIRPLHFNAIFSPVYWECLEPEEGVFDFTLVDGIIDQCRREGVRLILLWFGLWKNGVSNYCPMWVKKDTARFFRALDEHDEPLEVVSPYCEEGIAADIRAYEKLMVHIREVDGETHTVIMMQVENEVGTWNSERDFCAAANEAYAQPVPEIVARACNVSGTWEEAFGYHGCESLMAYQYATVCEKIAAAGKAIYPLPVFCNAFIEQYPKDTIPGMLGKVAGGFMSSYPSGGPVMATKAIWKACAPSVDVMSPDIYSPLFKTCADHYAQEDNALLIPETRATGQAAACAMYCVGEHNAVAFSPFGVDQMPSADPMSDGHRLAVAYDMLNDADDVIRKAHAQGHIWGFLQENDEFTTLYLDHYMVRIEFKEYRRMGPGMMAPPPADKPLSGGFILQLGEDDFLVAGTDIVYHFLPRTGSREVVRIDRKEEGVWKDGAWHPRRILNGDDLNAHHIDRMPAMQRIRLYRLPNKG